MEERALADISALCTCRRIETKWDESFSAASAERRGAHRLGSLGTNNYNQEIQTYDLQ